MGAQAGTDRIQAVAFDIGETLLDRSREYAAWAARFGVPAHTFSAVFGAMIQQGARVEDVLAFFAKTTGIPADRAALDVAPLADSDLYPDARRTITALKARGYRVVVAGNQPDEIGAQLRDLDLGADVVRSSAEWGVRKPEPEFFEQIVTAAECAPGQVVYVGDQLDHDVRAPLDAGLQAVWIRRGPWGLMQHDPQLQARCLATISTLDELLALSALGGRASAESA